MVVPVGGLAASYEQGTHVGPSSRQAPTAGPLMVLRRGRFITPPQHGMREHWTITFLSIRSFEIFPRERFQENCNCFRMDVQPPPRKVDARLPEKGNSTGHDARPVHQIMSMMKWVRTSRLPIKNSLSAPPPGFPGEVDFPPLLCWGTLVS